MIDKKQIESIVNEHLQGGSLFLVDCSVKPGNLITVYIDSDEKVCIDDCVELSRYIESKFDREQEDFALEVSSAGIDKPFKVLRQFTKNKGQEVKVITTEGKTLKGILINATENNIELQIKSKKRNLPDEKIGLEMSQIKSTSLIIKF